MNPLLGLALRGLDRRHSGARYDVIVVLGAALTPDGRLGPALAERVEAGARAFHAGLAPVVLATGALEATAMRARLLELAVLDSAILLEHSARTTRENALFSSERMREHGLARAVLVTQPYHRRRAVAAFRRAGVEAEALGFASRQVPPRQIVREYLALAIYRARGWL